MMMMMMQSKCRALNKKGQINREQSRRISFFFFCDRAEQREISGSSSFVLDATSTFFFFCFVLNTSVSGFVALVAPLASGARRDAVPHGPVWIELHVQLTLLAGHLIVS